MTINRKASLLAGVSAVAIGLMAASPASAFDTVNWNWNAQVNETITKTADIALNLAPSGMVMLEDLQVQIGDVQATSKVHDINNNQPLTADQLSSGPQDLTFYYQNDGTQYQTADTTPGVSNGDVQEAYFDPTQPAISGKVTLTYDVGALSGATFDATTELPSVVSAATAVANNTSITSDAAVQLHEGQFAFGSGSGDSSTPPLGGVNTTNSNLTAADVLGAMALGGGINPSSITAKSSVYNILNATVDSSATAVANNLSVNVAPSTPDNALVMGDVVQFADANVTAKSKVHDVSLNNYTNLGSITRPIVNSVATAVGNNKSITVMTPAPVVTPQ
jgi:hypothetical protein